MSVSVETRDCPSETQSHLQVIPQITDSYGLCLLRDQSVGVQLFTRDRPELHSDGGGRQSRCRSAPGCHGNSTLVTSQPDTETHMYTTLKSLSDDNNVTRNKYRYGIRDVFVSQLVS